MPAFDEAEWLRVLNQAIEQRAAKMARIHGATIGDATRMGRNTPQGHAYPTTTPGFATGYDGTVTTTAFVSDYSLVGSEDIVTGS
jgi:hypothetical protein